MAIRTLIFLTLVLAHFSASGATLPERLAGFINLFDESSATEKYDIRVLQTDFPTKLIAPEYMLPQTSRYPLKDLQQLYRLAKSCSGKLPLSPLVTEPLVFIRALCNNTPLSVKWFARTGLIHPGGGTYAYRYAKRNPASFERLQSYMHIKERPLADKATMLGRLQRMPYDALESLIAGEKMFLENHRIWIRKGDTYYIYPSSVWKVHAEAVELKYKLVSADDYCFVRRGNICWEAEGGSQLVRYSMIVLAVLDIFLVFGWFAYRWNVKRQELKKRVLVLQILTHELRTPIASLSMTVEGFRREFEHLPESVYEEFRKLCEDTRRLRQLAEASKDYLQSEHESLATEWIPSLREWIEYRLEEYQQNINLEFAEDCAVKVNIYWLGTCIDNLISNAVRYGVEPIKIRLVVIEKRLTVYVIDQGGLSQKEWRKLKQPFVSKSGLGLGLTIVESMVGRMGGTLTLQGPPTTFKMEIPCETDVTTG
ncbi:sensor histidine kinase VxrA [Vibrio sp. SCSIO 43137]|uniref:sensor histidine kinase VxrA n=1 Tax=Vibrio sp. SCSIO 43137 TaxID=3021011 RepID=UPI003FCC793C